METKPLIVIVGPTASGKTALAVSVAKQFNGEIICADSRTVYKGMDIGTAKPTKMEQQEVQHWGIDLASPDHTFTVADFKRYATEKIIDIRRRGKVPFLVGGSGLYIDSVVFDYQFGPKTNKEVRETFESMELEELYAYCIKNNIELPENKKNKRYVIRAIEQKSINSKRRETPIINCNIVGITTEVNILRDRIEQRSKQIFNDKILLEAKMLGDKYGWNHESMTGNIYPLCKKYLGGEITSEEARSRFVTLDWRLAKRQLTWLRRNEYINWLSLTDAEAYIKSLLESEH